MSDDNVIHMTPKEDEADEVIDNILTLFGIPELSGVLYVRSTETWFGVCPDCLMWVRDGHASIESSMALIIGRCAASSGASDQEARGALDEYTTALRDFGVEAIDDLDAPYDEAPDHKGRC